MTIALWLVMLFGGRVYIPPTIHYFREPGCIVPNTPWLDVWDDEDMCA